MSVDDFTQVLRHVSTAAKVAAPVIPGIGGAVLKVAGPLFALAADIASTGKDPIVIIERIRKVTPMLEKVERGWEDEMDRRFGPAPKPIDGPIDIYED